MILEARGITKTYSNGVKALVVFKGLDLLVAAGDLITIMGPSGAGKSTLLNVLGTLDRPDEGEILLNGRPVGVIPEPQLAQLRNRFLGFVFQFHHLLPEFTALENILIPTLIGGGDDSSEKRARELLDYVGLSDRRDHYPAQLSGGERSRVAVLRALINQPALVLADEPTGNLDIQNAAKLLDLLVSINRDFKQAIVLTTHNPEVARVGTRRLNLSNGTLEAVDVI